MIFKEVEINNFRGIKHLFLPNLKQVNLLVGKNNCGKSSVLDALFLLSGFSNPLLILRINQFRDYDSFAQEDISLNFYNMASENHILIQGQKQDGTVRTLEIAPIISESARIVLSGEQISTQALSNQEANITTGLSMNFSYTLTNGETISDRSARAGHRKDTTARRAQNKIHSCTEIGSQRRHRTKQIGSYQHVRRWDKKITGDYHFTLWLQRRDYLY